MCVVGVVVGVWSSAVLGHTRLVESVPANRSVSVEAPDRLRLFFAEAVDPRSVRLDVVSAGGESIEGAVLLTAGDPDVEVVEFSLPEFSDGVYGLGWVTVGPDGHRVAGEVVVGVGDLDGAAVGEVGLGGVPVLDRVLSLAVGVGRYVGYAGLALVVGAVLVRAWRLGRRPGAGTAVGVLSEQAGVALWWGALGLHVGLLVRASATVTLVARGYGTGSVGEDLRLALVDAMGLTLVGAAVASAVLVLGAPRLARTESRLVLLQGALGVTAIVAVGSATTHTSVLSEGPFGVWISTLHLLAAGVWLGPLLVVVWASQHRRWRGESAPARAAALRDFFRWFAPAALVAFVVLVLTGVRSAWVLAGAGFWSLSAYSAALWAKLALVGVVILPVALYHDRQVGWLAGRRCACSPRGGVSRRSLSLEAGGLCAVLVVTAALGGMNPAIFSGDDSPETPNSAPLNGARTATGSDAVSAESPSARDSFGEDVSPTDASTAAGGDGDTAELLALLSNEPPGDVAECRGRVVGQGNCYRDYFAAVMRREGADVAVAEIAALADTDEYVARDCHQVVHDLGNDAAMWYGDIGVALTYEGSACWSGYYHGVVEYAISQFDGTELYDEIPGICTSAAAVRYSLTHYNCVHGLGHGVMLNLDGDFFGAIPYCETLSDPWELGSCVSGIMMENVVSAQQGVPTELRTDDLIYPCNAVAEDYVDECFAMQTSWMLTQLGYTDAGFAEAFAICDTVRGDMVDDCYRSMGRDISGASLLAVDSIIHLCGLGHPDRQQDCYVGAALNAVYNDHDTIKATELCDNIAPGMRPACYSARDHAAGTL